MSKKLLIAWINSQEAYSLSSVEFKNICRNALKEQDRDTRHGCADAIITRANGHQCVQTDTAHGLCINYQDKDLAKLC